MKAAASGTISPGLSLVGLPAFPILVNYYR